MSPHCLSPRPSPSLPLNVFVAFFLLSHNSPSGPFSLYLSSHSLHIGLFHPFWAQMLSKSLTPWVWHQLPLRWKRLTSDLSRKNGLGGMNMCACVVLSLSTMLITHFIIVLHPSTLRRSQHLTAMHVCITYQSFIIFIYLLFCFFVVFFEGGGWYSSWTFSEVFQLHVGWMNMQSCFCDEHIEEYSKCWILIWFYRHVDLSQSFTAKMLQHRIKTLPCF